MRQYGCVMLTVPIKGWANVLAAVEQDDVLEPDGDQGYSYYPHITILYGLHQIENPLDLMLYVDKVCKKVEIEFTGVGLFENDKFDVLKFAVNCPVLNEYHDKIRNKFACTENFVTYMPHMTIAFLKKGTGWKYTNLAFSMPNVKIDLMKFTNADGHETLIKLNNG